MDVTQAQGAPAARVLGERDADLDVGAVREQPLLADTAGRERPEAAVAVGGGDADRGDDAAAELVRLADRTGLVAQLDGTVGASGAVPVRTVPSSGRSAAALARSRPGKRWRVSSIAAPTRAGSMAMAGTPPVPAGRRKRFVDRPGRRPDSAHDGD
ncbi:hypothetical protein [Kitasatospora sp. SolWspMP-SS2h]|uniref:hypothetical protein n=1 Tax=Kitasatospora sp. SolWspMP-SS2h TaxID=1305729 RepID=UPI0011B93603|nr:hypothetical protein [Kitasatospora sp. SolWspMP-SS2h]